MKHDILKVIAEHYGKECQLRQLMEECAEVILEASHSIRLKGCTVNLIREIADVEIMIEQVKYLFNISEEDIEEIKAEKIERQLGRIRNEKISDDKN